jgi:hypothetical protein
MAKKMNHRKKKNKNKKNKRRFNNLSYKVEEEENKRLVILNLNHINKEMNIKLY